MYTPDFHYHKAAWCQHEISATTRCRLRRQACCPDARGGSSRHLMIGGLDT